MNQLVRYASAGCRTSYLSKLGRNAGVLIFLLVAACISNSDDKAETTDPECQIQTPTEQTPGYPYDLSMFASQVLPQISADCSAAGCHGPPTGNGNLTIYPNAAPGNCDYARTFNALAARIDLSTPQNSALLIAVRGDLPTHPFTYPAGDPRLSALTAYVEDAAQRFASGGGGTTTPPPGASTFDFVVFQQVIQPIVDTAEGSGCARAGCHADGAGGMTLASNPAPDSDGMKANFLALSARTNLTNPETSLVYVKATTRHAGGLSSVASPEQAAALLAWIQAAADTGGGGGNPNCAPIERFNLAVFRDEILPILRGDVDLNNPGAGTSNGCMRGPCHGQDRGPGILRLSDQLDAAANLQNFACFVDLLNPSASEVLLCPLNDPRCRRYPHPGQNVFGGADDLNYQRLLAYLYGSGVDRTPLDFAFFVRRVNPIFNDINAVEGGAQGRTCADAVSCHGVGVAGQAPPNGSNFPIIPNATDFGRLSYNFATAASFVNFLDPDDSSLFLYPTNEIANVVDHPLATGLPHPGGADFAVDSQFARDILRWAGGLRPDAAGFITDWLVAGDYAGTLISDPTPINEANITPRIFDASGASQFNNGQWDGLFADNPIVNLNAAFPRAATNGRIAYAVAYVINTTSADLSIQLTLSSQNAARLYVDGVLLGQSDAGDISAVAVVPAYASAQRSTRILVKLLQRAGESDFSFALRARDIFGNALNDVTGELVIQLGPEGGI